MPYVIDYLRKTSGWHVGSSLRLLGSSVEMLEVLLYTLWKRHRYETPLHAIIVIKAVINSLTPLLPRFIIQWITYSLWFSESTNINRWICLRQMHHSIPPNHTNPKLLHIRMMISSLILADLGVVAIPVSNHKIIFQLLAEFKLSKTWDNLNLLWMHLSKEKLTRSSILYLWLWRFFSLS